MHQVKTQEITFKNNYLVDKENRHVHIQFKNVWPQLCNFV